MDRRVFKMIGKAKVGLLSWVGCALRSPPRHGWDEVHGVPCLGDQGRHSLGLEGSLRFVEGERQRPRRSLVDGFSEGLMLSR